MKNNLLLKSALMLGVILLSILLILPTFTNTRYFPELKINLGLDLKGGSYILLDIDTEQYDRDQLHQITADLEVQLRKEGLKAAAIEHPAKNILLITLHEGVNVEKSQLNKILNPYFNNKYNLKITGNKVEVAIDDDFFTANHKTLADQTLEIMRRRTDESGLKEIEIQKHGANGVLLQIPGIDDPDQLKRIIGKTAKLSFHLVKTGFSADDVLKGRVPSKYMVLSAQAQEGSYLIVSRDSVLMGDMLTNAQATLHDNEALVNLAFNNAGAKKFSKITSENIGKQLAIVLDGQVITAPVIREHIATGKSHISGNFTIESANELAMLLRAGALPAPLKIMEERTIGPSLGQDSIKAGINSMILAVIFIIITMLLLYNIFGFFALMGLALNLLMILAMLAVSGASLSLTGIAGLILTLGIAVDANVLIIERMREEHKKNQSIIKVINNGFSESFLTILDSNLTTVFSAIMLLIFGTGQVKGFAITLTLGIISSMFSAIVFTRFLTDVWFRWRRPKQIKI